MSKRLKILASPISYLGCSVIIALAILLSLLRLILPQLDLEPLREDIQVLVSETAGVPVQFEQVNVKILGPHLALVLRQVDLMDEQGRETLLRVGEVRVDLDLVGSLLAGEIRLGHVELRDTRLLLVERSDGRIELQGGLTSSASGQGDLRLPFLRHSSLRLLESEFYWVKESGSVPPLRIYDIDMELRNRGREHQFILRAGLDSKSQGEIRLIADLHERGGKQLLLDGQIYLLAEGLNLAHLPAALQPAGHQVGDGALRLQLWGDVEQSRLQQVTGDWELRDLLISGGEPIQHLGLENLSAKIDWRKLPQGWRLDLNHLTLVRNSRLWPPGRYSLEWVRDRQAVRLRAGADYLSVKDVSEFAALFLAPDAEAFKVLLGLSPQGDMSRFRFALDLPDQGPPRWQTRGRLTSYRHTAWQQIPGLEGLRLEFAGGDQGGRVWLESDQFSADFGDLFRTPLQASRLKGELEWHLRPGEMLRLSSSHLYMKTPHVETLSRLDIQVPLAGGVPLLDMQTDFWNGDGAEKSRYLPTRIMPPELTDWLDRAIVGGQVTAGSFLLYGPLDRFPFTGQEGRFEVLFGVEQAVLDYMPEWPRIEEATAEVHFLNNSLKIRLYEGRLLDSQLTTGRVVIDELDRADEVQIRVSLEGPFNDAARVLGETPLKAHFERFLKQLKLGGECRLSLNFNVPLLESKPFRFNGVVDLENARLGVEQWDLALESVEGRLVIDQHKLQGQDIQARLFGESVQVNVLPQTDADGPRSRVEIALPLRVEQLQRQFPQLADYPLTGSSEARLVLDIAHAEAAETPLRLSLESELRGLAVDQPQPLGKQAGERRPLKLLFEFQADERFELQAEYGPKLKAHLAGRAEGRIERGEIVVGGAAPRLPAQPGLQVRGQLNELDLDQWMRQLSSHWQSPGHQEGLLESLDLQVEQLKLAGVEQRDAHLQITQMDDAWWLQLQSDKMDGGLRIPTVLESEPLYGRFKLWSLETSHWFADEPEAEQVSVVPSAVVDPRQLPGLNLEVEQLQINGRAFGRVEMKWSKTPDGLQLDRFALNGERLELLATGHWSRRGSRDSSAYQVTGNAANLGQLLSDLGISATIEKASLALQANLRAERSPLDLSLADLEGEFSLNVGPGSVPDVDPGMGGVIVLFSLRGLINRLTLDFSDITPGGFIFEGISGQFDLKQGNAYTENLRLESPVARIDISGRTGLKAQDYEQLVRVTPRVSSTLPLFGALALNPSVGIALMIAQPLIGEGVDRIARVEYRVSGSWDKPRFEKIERAPVAEFDETELP
jgi:uncharacterized protein (TIGR02099 family)